MATADQAQALPSILEDAVPRQSLAYYKPVPPSAPEQEPELGESSDSDSDDGGSHGKRQALVRTLTIAILVVLALLLIVYAMAPRDLALRLARRGWVLYVRDGCGYCTEQLRALGGHYPKTVECTSGGKLVKSYCDNPPFKCSSVSGFPYWYSTATKETKTGLQSKKTLEKMAAQT